MILLNNGLISSHNSRAIVDGQVQVAFARTKVLYSVDFGLNWQEMQLPYSPSSSPIVGGAFSLQGFAPGLYITHADRQYRRTVNPQQLSAIEWVENIHGSGELVLSAKGPGVPSYVMVNRHRASKPSPSGYSFIGNYNQTVRNICTMNTNHAAVAHSTVFSVATSYIFQQSAFGSTYGNICVIAASPRSTSSSLEVAIFSSKGRASYYSQYSQQHLNPMAEFSCSATSRDGKNYGLSVVGSVWIAALDNIYQMSSPSNTQMRVYNLSAPARGVRMVGTYATVVTKDGKIYRSSDSGYSWVKVYDNSSLEFMEVDILPEPTGRVALNTFFN